MANEIEYVIVERDKLNPQELGVVSASGPREAAQQALEWVSGLEGWESWELLERQTREVVAWASATEDGVALVVAGED